MIKIILFLFLFTLIGYGDFFLQDDDLTLTPRQMSLGGSGVSYTDAQAFLFNPGGLSIYDRYVFNLSYYRVGISGLDLILGSAVIPINSRNVIALELSDYGFAENSLSYSENKFGLTYNNQILDFLSLGARFYYLRQNAADETGGSVILPKSIRGNGFGLDFGMTYNPLADLKIGLALRRIGDLSLRYNHIQNSVVSRFSWTIGLSYRWNQFLFTSDLNDRIQQGLEYQPVKGFFVRCGYYKSLIDKEALRFTMGFGLSLGQFEMNYGYLTHEFLPSTHLFTLTTDLIKQSKVLEIRNAGVEPIYTGIYQHYSQYPPAYATIKNNSAEKIKFRAGIKIKGLMDDYSKTPSWTEVPPNGFVQVKIPVIIPHSRSSVNENFNSQGEIMIEFNYGSKEYQVKETKKVRVYGSRFLTWDDPSKLASFVNPTDSTIMKFAKVLVNEELSVSYWESVNPSVKSAGLIYSGLQLYGLKYSKDPNVPDISKQSDQLDYIQFPGETFTYKSGDCDDLVVLFASCLESMGIHTAFISVPGHIFLAVDSNISDSDFEQVTLNKNSVILADGKVWIPLELTLIGTHDFLTSWRYGMKLFNKHRDELEFFPLKTAWEKFPPTTSYSNSISFQVIPEYLKKIWKRNMNKLRNDLMQEVERKFSAVHNKNYQYHNDIGVAYARMGFLSKAKNHFIKAVQLNPQFSHSYANLANYYLQIGNYDQAISNFKKSLSLQPNDSELCLNIAIAYALKKDYQTGRYYLNRAIQLNPKMKEEYENQYRSYNP